MTEYYRSTFSKCSAEWQRAGVALGGYNTEQSSDDLEDLREALGTETINLWGISYGSHLALATMRRHPKSINRVALASAEGMDQTVKLPFHVDAAFGRADVALGGVDLQGLIRRVHARYATPQMLVLKSPHGELRVESDAFAIQLLAGAAAKNPQDLSRLIGFYQALDEGRTDLAAGAIYQSLLEKPLTFSGMPEAMDLASGISKGRLAKFEAQAKDEISGRALNFPMPQLRGSYPGLQLSKSFRREVRSSIPTLLLSGDLDIRTPFEEQKAAVAGLTRLHQVRVTNGGHDLWEAHPDIPQLLADFFRERPLSTTELRLTPPALAR